MDIPCEIFFMFGPGVMTIDGGGLFVGLMVVSLSEVDTVSLVEDYRK